MTTDSELQQQVANVRSVISTFGPTEQATCLMLLEASTRTNAAADAWSEECEAIITDIMAALNGPEERLREQVVGVLKATGDRMAKRWAAMKEAAS